MTLRYFYIRLYVGAALAAVFLFLAAAYAIDINLFKPYQSEGKERIFIISKGENLLIIGEGLEKEGLIPSRWVFDLYVLFKGKEKTLKAGAYQLSPATPASQIARTLWEGHTAEFAVSIPEGFTREQIEDRLRSKGILGDGSYFGDATAGSWKDEFAFLQDAPEAASLEGFLFPDTYSFGPQVSDSDIIEAMLMNFDAKISPELKLAIGKRGRTIFEVVIMASILEKEVKTPEERRLVAGILWKRMAAGVPLQADATLNYVLRKKNVNISAQDLKIDSPYNTYKYLGLPAGPISNPGIDSIRAAISYEKSDYWYYLSKPDGTTVFSRTLEEHNRAKAKYLR